MFWGGWRSPYVGYMATKRQQEHTAREPPLQMQGLGGGKTWTHCSCHNNVPSVEHCVTHTDGYRDAVRQEQAT